MRVYDLRFIFRLRVQVLGFRVQGLAFCDEGLEFRVKVKGLGFRF